MRLRFTRGEVHPVILGRSRQQQRHRWLDLCQKKASPKEQGLLRVLTDNGQAQLLRPQPIGTAARAESTRGEGAKLTLNLVEHAHEALLTGAAVGMQHPMERLIAQRSIFAAGRSRE